MSLAVLAGFFSSSFLPDFVLQSKNTPAYVNISVYVFTSKTGLLICSRLCPTPSQLGQLCHFTAVIAGVKIK